MRSRSRPSVVAVVVPPVPLAPAAAGDPRVLVRPTHSGSGRQAIVHCSRHNGSPQQCRSQQPLSQGVAAARPDLVQPARAQAAQEERPPAEGTLRGCGYGARLHAVLPVILPVGDGKHTCVSSLGSPAGLPWRYQSCSRFHCLSFYLFLCHAVSTCAHVSSSGTLRIAFCVACRPCVCGYRLGGAHCPSPSRWPPAARRALPYQQVQHEAAPWPRLYL